MAEKDSLGDASDLIAETTTEKNKPEKHAGWDEENILQTLHPADKDYGFDEINERKTMFEFHFDIDELEEEDAAANEREPSEEKEMSEGKAEKEGEVAPGEGGGGEAVVEVAGVSEGDGVKEGEGVKEEAGLTEGDGVKEGEGVKEEAGLTEGDGVKEGEGVKEEAGLTEGEAGEMREDEAGNLGGPGESLEEQETSHDVSVFDSEVPSKTVLPGPAPVNTLSVGREAAILEGSFEVSIAPLESMDDGSSVPHAGAPTPIPPTPDEPTMPMTPPDVQWDQRESEPITFEIQGHRKRRRKKRPSESGHRHLSAKAAAVFRERKALLGRPPETRGSDLMMTKGPAPTAAALDIFWTGGINKNVAPVNLTVYEVEEKEDDIYSRVTNADANANANANDDDDDEEKNTNAVQKEEEDDEEDDDDEEEKLNIRQEIGYACAQVLVVLDLATGNQRILQGHGGEVSAVCVSEDKKWLATADKGSSNSIIVWETNEYFPVKTIFMDELEREDVHPNCKGGITAMNFSFGPGAYLGAISAFVPQEACVWDWSQETSVPMAAIQLDPAYGLHEHLIFNEVNPFEFATTSESQVFFFAYGDREIDIKAPILNDETFNEVVGRYSQTIYHTDEPHQALTATSAGKIVSWVLTDRPKKAARWWTQIDPHHSKVMPNDKKPHKLFTLLESSPLRSFTVLTAVPAASAVYHPPPRPLPGEENPNNDAMERIIVVGDNKGQIHFFDKHLKLVQFPHKKLHVLPRQGALTSISFDRHSPPLPHDVGVGDSPKVQMASPPFFCPDFVIATSDAGVCHIGDYATKGVNVLNENFGEIHAIATHPKKPLLCFAGHSGLVKLWDYERSEEKARWPLGSKPSCQCPASAKGGGSIPKRSQSTASTTAAHHKCLKWECCVFSPQGLFVALGDAFGRIYVVDTVSLGGLGPDDVRPPISFKTDAVTNLAFSHDDVFIAAADASFCVSIYRRDPVFSKMAPDEGDDWTLTELDRVLPKYQYVACHRAHYKPITSLVFGAKPLLNDEEKARLQQRMGEKDDRKKKQQDPNRRRPQVMQQQRRRQKRDKLLQFPRLFSLSEDRYLVEYNLDEMVEDDLAILRRERIEQSSVPMAMVWYPAELFNTMEPRPNRDSLRYMEDEKPKEKKDKKDKQKEKLPSAEPVLMMVNSDYKYRLVNANTFVTRRKILGPTYESPARYIKVLPKGLADPLALNTNYNRKAGNDAPRRTSSISSRRKHDTLMNNILQQTTVDGHRYAAFTTAQKVGLQLMPLDGNPHNSVAYAAHPAASSIALAVCHRGRFVFTAGGGDACVLMWEVNVASLEAASKLGGEGLKPFVDMLEGSYEGKVFDEFNNFFYYSALRTHGVNSLSMRKTPVTIPLSEIPFMMRALGYYPSEQEIWEMINEVNFSEFASTGKKTNQINLNQLIRLYINYRPAFGLNLSHFTTAFRHIAAVHTPCLTCCGDPEAGGDGSSGDVFSSPEAEAKLDLAAILRVLESGGEKMDDDELAEAMVTLVGKTEIGGSSEEVDFDPSKTEEIIEQHLSKCLTAEQFVNSVLDFGI